MLMRTPRMMVLTAWRVRGEPWAQMRRSEPVYGMMIYEHIRKEDRKTEEEEGEGRRTHRQDLPSFPNHTPLGTHIHHRAVQTAPRLLNQPRHKKHPRLRRDPFQHLPRTVAPPASFFPPFLLLEANNRIPRQPPRNPIHPAASALPNHIAQVNSLLPVP